MAKIIGYREISLDDLIIDRGQVRTSPGAGIDELAQSIKVQGLLQPIVVCESRNEGKWEILTGQRRFLAHKMLSRSKITAAVLDTRVAAEEAKAISITENLVRKKLSGKELKDGIRYLYNTYGSIQNVHEATGLSHQIISDNVKYPRLVKELKELVDKEEVEINVALKAQDASLDESGEPNVELALSLLETFKPMSNIQRKKVVQRRKEHPDQPIDEAIEYAITGAKTHQVIATVTQQVLQAIKSVAAEEQLNQDEATATLIEEALTGRGVLN